MSAANVNFFFTLREQIKLFHWQTTSFAKHTATDGVIKSLDETIDKYVEIYMGTYGRPRMTPKTATVHVSNLTEKSIIRFIRAAIEYLEVDLLKGLKPRDTDLVNLRDEMLGEMNQLLFLFTLN
jgi:hypothetical protein